jgi:hypothetical protein
VISGLRGKKVRLNCKPQLVIHGADAIRHAPNVCARRQRIRC